MQLWSTADQYVERPGSHPEEQHFAYRGEQEVDGLRFMVTTYLSKGYFCCDLRLFFLEMENQEDRSEKYRIELPEQKARDLLRISYKGKIEKMIQHLSVDRTKQICFLRYAPATDV